MSVRVQNEDFDVGAEMAALHAGNAAVGEISSAPISAWVSCFASESSSVRYSAGRLRSVLARTIATGRSKLGVEDDEALVHRNAISVRIVACVAADKAQAGIVRCRAGAVVGLAMGRDARELVEFGNWLNSCSSALSNMN